MPLLDPNFNDTQWLSADRLRVISPVCLPRLGTGINSLHGCIKMGFFPVFCLFVFFFFGGGGGGHFFFFSFFVVFFFLLISFCWRSWYESAFWWQKSCHTLYPPFGKASQWPRGIRGYLIGHKCVVNVSISLTRIEVFLLDNDISQSII